MFCPYCGKKAAVEDALFCWNCGKPVSATESVSEPLVSQSPESNAVHEGTSGDMGNETGKYNEESRAELKTQEDPKPEESVSGEHAVVADLPHLDVIASLKRVFANLIKSSKFVVPLSREVSPDARDLSEQFLAIPPGEKPLALFGKMDRKGQFAGILVTDAFVRWRIFPVGSSLPSSWPSPRGWGWKLTQGQIEHSKISSIGFATIEGDGRLFVVNDNPMGLFADGNTNAALVSAATEFCGLVTARSPEIERYSHSVAWIFNGNVGEELPSARFSFAVAGICVLMYLLQWMLGAFSDDAQFVKVAQSLGGNLPIWGPLVCGFMHGGFIHLLVNVIGLVTFCVSVERIFGTKLFACVYLASVLGGGVCAAMGAPGVMTVGASGGLFGIMGTMCAFGGIRYFSVKNRLSGFDRQRVYRWIKGYGALLLGNIYFTSRFRKLANISVEAHLGGLLVGLAFGVVALVLVPPRRETTTGNGKLEKLAAWTAGVRKKIGAIWAACRGKISAIWKRIRTGKTVGGTEEQSCGGTKRMQKDVPRANLSRKGGLLAAGVAIVLLAGIVGILKNAHQDEDEVDVGRDRTAVGRLDADGQYRLGMRYIKGQGVEQSDEEAARWFRKAAEQGHANAQYNLGMMLAKGRGVEQSDAEATKWFRKAAEPYRKAAEQGNADAQRLLGVMFENGRGVPQSDAKAVEWYWKAAEQGNADAQVNLGWMFERGRGVVQNYAEAAKWYRKAAEQGNIWGQVTLAGMYMEGLGVAQNDAAAARWFRKAAEQGNADAQVTLAGMFEKGRGVPQNYAEAMKWYRKAAEQGDTGGQVILAGMYVEGLGVAQNDAEAAKWYRKAAEQGNADAQYLLGRMYELGRGVPQSDATALEWFRKAEEQRQASASAKASPR